jgi:hypothetical protein
VVRSPPFLELLSDYIDYYNLKEEERLTYCGDNLTLDLIACMGDSLLAEGSGWLRDFVILLIIYCCEMNFPCLNSP